MPGRGKTEAIFAVRQRMEKHQGKQTVLHMVFKDLEKACDRVPRQKVWRRIREKGVPEKCISIHVNPPSFVRSLRHFDITENLRPGDENLRHLTVTSRFKKMRRYTFGNLK